LFNFIERMFYFWWICESPGRAVRMITASPVPPLRPLSGGGQGRSVARVPGGGYSHVRLITWLPAPTPQGPPKFFVRKNQVYILGTVARPASSVSVKLHLTVQFLAPEKLLIEARAARAEKRPEKFSKTQ